MQGVSAFFNQCIILKASCILCMPEVILQPEVLQQHIQMLEPEQGLLMHKSAFPINNNSHRNRSLILMKKQTTIKH